MLGITVLGSGSRGNAVLVHNEKGTVLVDTGFSAKEILRRMKVCGCAPENVQAIIISHEHEDHVRGLSRLASLWQVPVYCNRLTADVIRDKRSGVDQFRLFTAGNSFETTGFYVEPFTIPHDAIDPVGFAISDGQRKVSLATDLGHISPVVRHYLADSDILVVESNHDLEMLRNSSRPWSLKQRVLSRHGHLSNDASTELLGNVVGPCTKHVFLVHASQDCNRYELVQETAGNFMRELGRPDVTVRTATQDDVLETAWS